MKVRIKILAPGWHSLPIGIKVKSYKEGELRDNWIYEREERLNVCTHDDGWSYEVDFSELPPLYPTPDMGIGATGIEFTSGDGKIIDIGSNGITYKMVKDKAGSMCFNEWPEVDKFKESFKLKRTLPKTIEVCSDCFKELCECLKESKVTYEVKAIEGDDFLEDTGGEISEETEFAVVQCEYENNELQGTLEFARFGIEQDAVDYIKYRKDKGDWG